VGKPDPPTPPNPYATAAAQTGTNVSTAVANAYLGQVNQNTPDGSLSYAATGSHQWTDPVSNQTYTIPTFTSTQTLSPAGQQLKDTNLQTQQNLANMGRDQSSRVSGLLSTPFNPSGSAPTGGNVNTLLDNPFSQKSYDPGGQIQSTFGDAGDITRSYGADNFSSDRQRVEDSLMQRMNPQLAIEKQGITQQLADQGIRPGSQAYSDAMMNYSRQANDARLGAISQAGSEQQRMMDMAAQQAGFQNAAQQQAYEQAQGRGSFANSAQAQQNAQNAGQAGFYNASLAQDMSRDQSIFNAANSQRNQYMQEQYQQRNQPLNEISALMSGSQVQQPNWLNSPTSQIPTTDFAGIMNANTQAQQQAYATAQSGWNSTIGGVLGLGAGALKGGYISDRREKENITKMGTVFAADSESSERKQLPIYQYSYKKDPASVRHIGPMAQDVEKITPEAVGELEGGVKYIKPQRLMGSILRAG
jgi:Chaperone of endosialidase